jgi:hypothetical protein
MIWYQLGMLDVRTCEAHGPRPGIREGEFDTQFPLNVNDRDLELPNPPTTLTLIRMQCNEMNRTIWFDRPRIEKKQISLTAVLGKVENFRRVMHERYLPMLNRPDGTPTDNPLHQATRLILTLTISRMHVMVLNRYHNAVSSKIPERLRSIIRSHGTDSIEAAMLFETTPRLAPWHWVAGALQQYHAAFLLLVEVYQYPNFPQADRLWHVLDWVFEPPLQLDREQKAVVILQELSRRLQIYHSARKSKGPLALMKRFVHDGKRPSTNPGTGANEGGEADWMQRPEKELYFVGPPGGELRRSDSKSPRLPQDNPTGPSAEALAAFGLAGMGMQAPLRNLQGVDQVAIDQVAVGMGPVASGLARQQMYEQGTTDVTGAMPAPGGTGVLMGVGAGPGAGVGQGPGLGIPMAAMQNTSGLSPESLGSGLNVDDLMADIDWVSFSKNLARAAKCRLLWGAPWLTCCRMSGTRSLDRSNDELGRSGLEFRKLRRVDTGSRRAYRVDVDIDR